MADAEQNLIDVRPILGCNWFDGDLNRTFAQAFADGVKTMLGFCEITANNERRLLELRFHADVILAVPFAEAEVWPEAQGEDDDQDWVVGIAQVIPMTAAKAEALGEIARIDAELEALSPGYMDGQGGATTSATPPR